MVDLGEHQIKAIKELRNGSILKGGVGTGKTRTAIAYYFARVCSGGFPVNGVGTYTAMASGRDVYVITTAKKRDDLDWDSEFAWFLLGKDRETSYGGVKTHVDSWNNISKYTDVKGAFFIFDEQRLVGSGEWVKSFYKIAAKNQWIVLSATPGDTWSDYIPVFVANGFYKNKTEFLNRHAIFSRYSKYPKIDRYTDTERLVRLRDRILVDMPYERLTRRIIEQLLSTYDDELLKKITEDRWDPWKNQPVENISQLFYLMRKAVNSDPSRIDHLHRVVNEKKKVIVFYNYTYELDILREYARDNNVPFSEWNGEKHQEILEEEDSWLYLVQYTAGAEGWNCITTDTIFFHSLTYSWKQFEQSQGRTDRMNTPFTELWNYVCRSNSPIDQSIWKALKTKKNFNEMKTALAWNTPFLTKLPEAA